METFLFNIWVMKNVSKKKKNDAAWALKIALNHKVRGGKIPPSSKESPFPLVSLPLVKKSLLEFGFIQD